MANNVILNDIFQHDFQIYVQKQKRVKIVSVGPDGQCHELAKAHIPQGKNKRLACSRSHKCSLEGNGGVCLYWELVRDVVKFRKTYIPTV